MASPSPEPDAKPHLAEESSTSSITARQEEAPQEPVSEEATSGEEEEEKEEDEGAVCNCKGRCGLYVFMKGGDCKDTYVALGKCVQESKKEGSDVRCYQARVALVNCMDAHADYYAPLLHKGWEEEEDDDEAELEWEKNSNDALEWEKEDEGGCWKDMFMKSGCKDAFMAWVECVETSERCHQVTTNLKNCVDAHTYYDAPLLRPVQATSDQAGVVTAGAVKDKEGEPPAGSTPSYAEDTMEETASSSPAA